MKALRAKDAKYGFGRLIDLARAAPVVTVERGLAVVVVLVVEEFELPTPRTRALHPHLQRIGSGGHRE